eukprot:6079790-Prymnesium_polylepis.1
MATLLHSGQEGSIKQGGDMPYEGGLHQAGGWAAPTADTKGESDGATERRSEGTPRAQEGAARARP